MELYTRMIDDGIFIFWEDDNSKNYELSVYICNEDKKIRLVNLMLESGISYYSLTNVGSGTYEIELKVYNGGKLIETVTENTTLKSASLRSVELLDKLDDILNKLHDIEYSVDHMDLSSLDTLANALTSPNETINRDNWAKFLIYLKRNMNYYYEHDWEL